MIQDLSPWIADALVVLGVVVMTIGTVRVTVFFFFWGGLADFQNFDIER